MRGLLKRWTVGPIMASLVLAAGCASQTPADAPQSAPKTEGAEQPKAAGMGGTLTFGLGYDIVAVDPAFAYDPSTDAVVDQITEGLLKYDKNSQLAPSLAERWEAKDPVTYLYYLRKDVTFSDGSPMTIDDVIFSMERTRDPKTASYLGWMYENVDKIEKADEWTVKVTLKKPDALWRYVMGTPAGHVISKKYYEAHKDNFGKPDGGVLGTGPFKYVSWKTGSEIVIEKNTNYWDKTGGPYLDKVVYKVIPEGTTRVTGLKTGQINMLIGLPLDLVEVVEGMDNVNIQKVDGLRNDVIAFNTQRKPFNDVKVRQAMNYALDKQKIMDQIVRGMGMPARAVPVSPTLWTFAKDKWEVAYKELPDYAYNLDKAKQLLAESSVPNGFSAKILTDNDTLKMNSVLALQAAVKPLGINLEIEKVTGEELTTRGFGGARDYDIIANDWGSDFPDPSGNLVPIFHSAYVGEGGANYANYRNPELDKLLDEQSKLIDDNQRADLMIQAEKIIAEETPWIMLDHPKQIMVTTKGVEGVDGYSETPLWTWNAYMKDIKIVK
ncbi:ABC transporter substrate-binding protein [Brevibacillus fluminis]|uniref:ABC transporter substrate-binding protein n=1 Tax=Brevibacillus fluminis TaxID=511487 RepID=A0A3M8D452_9BACL|nr:ABC transporter substrate-binding protein [Brevibacillus fluminis]RNB82371.1 ABC transporter substrate-binding protein [Brevibacillus fluminis]